MISYEGELDIDNKLITFSKLQVFLKMCLDHKKILGKQE